MINSLYPLGGLVGSLSFSPVARKVGRKAGSRLICVIQFIGCSIIATSRDPLMLLTSRFIAGYSASCCLILIPLFSAEIAEPTYVINPHSITNTKKNEEMNFNIFLPFSTVCIEFVDLSEHFLHSQPGLVLWLLIVWVLSCVMIYVHGFACHFLLFSWFYQFTFMRHLFFYCEMVERM